MKQRKPDQPQVSEDISSGISILYESESAGSMKLHISVPGKEQVRLSQYIIPLIV